jgi:hypothetical protein
MWADIAEGFFFLDQTIALIPRFAGNVQLHFDQIRIVGIEKIDGERALHCRLTCNGLDGAIIYDARPEVVTAYEKASQWSDDIDDEYLREVVLSAAVAPDKLPIKYAEHVTRQTMKGEAYIELTDGFDEGHKVITIYISSADEKVDTFHYLRHVALPMGAYELCSRAFYDDASCGLLLLTSIRTPAVMMTKRPAGQMTAYEYWIFREEESLTLRYKRIPLVSLLVPIVQTLTREMVSAR